MTTFACEDAYPNQGITRNCDGSFTWSLNGGGHFTMEFDHDGNYVCQWQEVMYEYSLIKIVSKDVVPLTPEQMATAT